MKRLTNNTRVNAVVFCGDNNLVLGSSDMNMTFGEYMLRCGAAGVAANLQHMMDMTYTHQRNVRSGSHTLAYYVSNEQYNGAPAQFVEIL